MLSISIERRGGVISEEAKGGGVEKNRGKSIKS